MSQISRRKFIVHSAHTTIGVSAGLAALQAAEPAGLWAAEEPARESRWRSAWSPARWNTAPTRRWPAFQGYLEKRYRVRCTRAFMKTEKDLPGLENLDHCDCMLLFTRRLTLPADQLERVKRYCQRGGPIVGLRTASHAFQNWLALDKEVLGRRLPRPLREQGEAGHQGPPGGEGSSDPRWVQAVRFRRKSLQEPPACPRYHGASDRHDPRPHGAGRLDPAAPGGPGVLHLPGPSGGLPAGKLPPPAGQRPVLDHPTEDDRGIGLRWALRERTRRLPKSSRRRTSRA